MLLYNSRFGGGGYPLGKSEKGIQKLLILPPENLSLHYLPQKRENVSYRVTLQGEDPAEVAKKRMAYLSMGSSLKESGI